MERHRARWSRAGDVPDLRRRRRRHLSRDRQHARAHQHAGGADVGARPGSTARHRAVRRACRCQLARRYTAIARQHPVHVHGAEPAVPDGQPHRIQRLQPADAHHRGRARLAGRAPRRASHGHGRGARRLCPRRGAHRPGRAARLRRISGVRGQHLHLHRGLPAVGERRRHGASQQHDSDKRELDPLQPVRPARHGVSRVLPRLERGAHPPALARAV